MKLKHWKMKTKNIQFKNNLPCVKLKSMKYSFLLFCFLTVKMTFAQQKTIGLEESKQAALHYSNNVKTGKLRIEEAEAAKREAFANYFPSIDATGVGLYGFDDIISPLPGLLDEEIGNLYFAGATASEVLYAGGRINSYNKMADVQVEVNTIRAEQAIDSVLLITEQKYWGLVQLQEEQEVLKSSKAYLDQLLKQQQDLLDAGLIARNDLLRVKVQRSQLLLERSKLQNAHKIALLDFALYTGMEYDTAMVAADVFPTVVPPQIKYGSPSLSLNNNSTYQLVERSVTAAELQTRVARSELLPAVSVGVSASQFGSFDGSLGSNFIPIGFGMVSIPISDWWGAGRHKIKQQEIREEIASNDLKDVEDQLKIAIMKSWYDLLDAYKQIDYSRENQELAEENLRVTRDNFSSGLNNVSDLMDAQRMYQQAQTEMVRAFANYQEKEGTYLFHSGRQEPTN